MSYYINTFIKVFVCIILMRQWVVNYYINTFIKVFVCIILMSQWLVSYYINTFISVCLHYIDETMAGELIY